MGKAWSIALVGALAACSSAPELAPVDGASYTARSAFAGSESCKPEAPIDLEMEAVEAGNGWYEVTVRGTARADLDTVVVELHLPAGAMASAPTTLRFGRTAPGETRELAARVWVEKDAARLVSSVQVDIAGLRPARLTSVTLGTPAEIDPPGPTVTVASGEVIEEVQP